MAQYSAGKGSTIFWGHTKAVFCIDFYRAIKNRLHTSIAKGPHFAGSWSVLTFLVLRTTFILITSNVLYLRLSFIAKGSHKKYNILVNEILLADLAPPVAFKFNLRTSILIASR